MNIINPKKLLNSKWTAVQPENEEKHFIISKLSLNELGEVDTCVMEAIMTKRWESIDWRQLKNQARWIQGWN